MDTWADYIVLAGIASLLVLAVWLMRRSRTKGGCASCPHAKGCERRRPSIDCSEKRA